MSDEAAAGSPPAAARLAALDSDDWAMVLRCVREVLAREPHAGDPTLAAFREATTSRLVGGRLRARLTSRLSSDAALWSEVAAAMAVVAGDGPSPASLDALVSGERGPRAEVPQSPPESPDEARAALALGKQRTRRAREERDAWRRRAEGADARAERLAAEVELLTAELARVRGQLVEATAALATAAADRDRAVERERRRRDTEIAAVEEQLAALRREEQARRVEQRRRAEAKRQSELDAQRAAADALRHPHADQPVRIVPGRPSRLPRGIAPGTTEAARELLHRNRLVLVDGYNVSKQHRGHLDLETQRTWLVQQLGLLARQRGVRPTVIFDGQASGGGRPAAGLRDVTVRFTDAGITADDEIVLAVEGTDEPVVVVTDDRELSGRVAASGADVIGTRSLLGVVR